jgi:hypothetical protein
MLSIIKVYAWIIVTDARSVGHAPVAIRSSRELTIDGESA